jgi:hypothetical protein
MIRRRIIGGLGGAARPLGHAANDAAASPPRTALAAPLNDNRPPLWRRRGVRWASVIVLAASVTACWGALYWFAAN